MAFAIAIFTLTSCESVPMPYDFPDQGGGSETVDPTGSGTAADPYNIAALNNFAKNLDQGSSSEGLVYFRGKVVSFKSGEEPGNSYGNATFYMSDDGSATNQFYVYRCKGPGNTKITDANLFKVGDELVVCGKITNYNGTLETEQNTAYIVSINGEGGDTPGSTTEPAGSGTKEDPYNVAKANEVCAALEKSSTSASYLSDEVYVKGKIASITDTELSSYGNITYYISDDGTTTGQLEVYRGLSIDGAKFKTINDIKVGDEVVVKGKLQNWLGTYEFTQGSSLVSINGQGGEGGGDTPSGEAKGDGSQANPFNVPGIIAYTSALAADAQSSEKVYFKGIVSQTKDISATYGNATFYISEDGKTSNEFYVFRCLGLNGAAIASSDDVKVGDEVVIYGTVTNYKGNTPETVQKEAYIVSLSRGGESGGGDTPATSDGISVNGTTVTLNNAAVTAGTETVVCTVNDLGITDKSSAEGTYTLSDGSTLTVAKGDGKSGPTYYAASNGFRIYASNTLTFDCKNNVATIVFECDSYNGTNYVGNETATVTFNGKNVVYCNKNDANSGGVQLRVKKITITYAQ